MVLREGVPAKKACIQKYTLVAPFKKLQSARVSPTGDLSIRVFERFGLNVRDAAGAATRRSLTLAWKIFATRPRHQTRATRVYSLENSCIRKNSCIHSAVKIIE